MRVLSLRRRSCRTLIVAALLAAALTMTAGAQTPVPATGSDLEGTAWELVKIEGTDAKIHGPAARGQYLLAFTAHGELSARIDCNRGSGTWSSPEPGQLVLGPLASTRAQCPPASLYDEIIAHWTEVRAYAIREGHLFLTGGGGVYEYAPLQVAPTTGGATPH
jgi:para-nitrobenzyl esterase